MLHVQQVLIQEYKEHICLALKSTLHGNNNQ